MAKPLTTYDKVRNLNKRVNRIKSAGFVSPTEYKSRFELQAGALDWRTGKVITATEAKKRGISEQTYREMVNELYSMRDHISVREARARRFAQMERTRKTLKKEYFGFNDLSREDQDALINQIWESDKKSKEDLYEVLYSSLAGL